MRGIPGLGFVLSGVAAVINSADAGHDLGHFERCHVVCLRL
jgi:hypothetical protein